mmetsp:Transcript_68690/g.212361  ORF Transcript_68690/g.212361 Transcript_68690/m.212361 type:complete len:229 (-) Transcript_68690:500-1186(-)
MGADGKPSAGAYPRPDHVLAYKFIRLEPGPPRFIPVRIVVMGDASCARRRRHRSVPRAACGGRCWAGGRYGDLCVRGGGCGAHERARGGGPSPEPLTPEAGIRPGVPSWLPWWPLARLGSSRRGWRRFGMQGEPGAICIVPYVGSVAGALACTCRSACDTHLADWASDILVQCVWHLIQLGLGHGSLDVTAGLASTQSRFACGLLAFSVTPGLAHPRRDRAADLVCTP